MSTDISALTNRPVVIGGGAAGLMTALQLAPEPVLVVSKAPLPIKGPMPLKLPLTSLYQSRYSELISTCSVPEESGRMSMSTRSLAALTCSTPSQFADPIVFDILQIICG